MLKVRKVCEMLHGYRLTCWIGLIVGLFWSSLTMAQQPTATMRSFKGEVFVSFQGEPQLPAVEGAVLPEGTAVRTYDGASAVLTLPDGSKVQLGEKTNLLMTALTKDVQKPITMPRLELLWGSLRAVLSPLHQNPGSSFTVHTPNALVKTSSSEVDAGIQYEPATKTTTVLAHEFEIRVTNLFSGASRLIPQGHSGIIYEGIIQEVARILDVPPTTLAGQQTATVFSFQGGVFVSIQGEKWTPVVKGTVLLPGDALQTKAKANAVVQFPDETTVTLDENTTFYISRLMKDVQADAWIASLDLLRGTLRMILGKGFQKEESSFTVQTLNVQITMTPARIMDAEIIYDPQRSISTVMAHKSSLELLHRLTERSATIPSGHSAIIHNNAIQQVGRILRPLKKEPKKK